MDSKDAPKSMLDKVVNFITDKNNAWVTVAGAGAALVGVTPVLILSGTYLAVRTASGVIKENIRFAKDLNKDIKLAKKQRK